MYHLSKNTNKSTEKGATATNRITSDEEDEIAIQQPQKMPPTSSSRTKEDNKSKDEAEKQRRAEEVAFPTPSGSDEIRRSKEAGKLRLADGVVSPTPSRSDEDSRSKQAGKLRLADAVEDNRESIPGTEDTDDSRVKTSRSKESKFARLGRRTEQEPPPRVPGVQFVPGIEPDRNASPEDNANFTNPEPATLNAYPVPEEDDKSIANATILDSTFCTRKRIVIAIILLLVIVAAIGVAAVFGGTREPTETSAENVIVVTPPPTPMPPTPIPTISLRPTFSPTPLPSNFPLSWNEIGHIDIAGSGDEYGDSVAISSNGLVIVSAAPNEHYAEVTVHKYVQSYWKRVGTWNCYSCDDILGARFGESVSISEDGNIVAFGMPASAEGRVSIYQYDSRNQTYTMEMGEDIVVRGFGRFGSSVSLSGNGLRMVVGYDWNTTASVFEFRNGRWEEIGSLQLPQTGDSNQPQGTAVSISRNGLIVAVSIKDEISRQPRHLEAGQVTMYRYESDNVWIQMGQQLRGVSRYDLFGYSVDIANNGLTVAIGAPLDDGPKGPSSVDFGQVKMDPDVGAVRVYDFEESSSQWVQRGDDLQGSENFDSFGSSLSISHDGKSIVVGAISGSNAGPDSGYAKVFRYDTDALIWVPVGQTINGISPDKQAGTSVGISDDGNIVVIGSPHDGNSGSFSVDPVGLVQTYITGVRIQEEGRVAMKLFVTTSGWLTGERVVWLERLDVPTISDGPVVIGPSIEFSYAEAGDLKQTEVTFNLESDGLYRLFINLRRGGADDDQYEDPDPRVFLDGERMEFEGVTEYTFLPSGRVKASAGTEEKQLLLVMQFDSNPEDIHWVLKATWPASDASNAPSGRSTWETAVLDFGPAATYNSTLSGSELRYIIDVSRAPVGADCTLIVYDMGIEREVSYQLYEGVEADKSLLVVDASGQVLQRKATHYFILSDASSSGGILPPQPPTSRPTEEPTDSPAGEECERAIGPLVLDGGIVYGSTDGAEYDFQVIGSDIAGEESCLEVLVDRGPGMWYYVVGSGSPYRATACGALEGILIFEGTCDASSEVSLSCHAEERAPYRQDQLTECTFVTWSTVELRRYYIYIYAISWRAGPTSLVVNTEMDSAYPSLMPSSPQLRA